MLLSRSPKRTNWHIQWVNLFFWPLWSVWQYWSLPPFWTFCNSLLLTLHLNSLPVLLLFLYYSFSVSFTSNLFLLCPPLNVDVKKKKLMSARVQLWPFFFSSHYVLASANTYMLMSLKSVWSPNLFWSLDPNSQLPAGQLHLDDSWASQTQCIQLTKIPVILISPCCLFHWVLPLFTLSPEPEIWAFFFLLPFSTRYQLVIEFWHVSPL